MSHTRQLLLCAACAKELSGFADGSFSGLRAGQLASINSNADVLITGVGCFQTVYNLADTLSSGNYGMVLAAGVAGEYDISRGLCRMYAVTRSVFADCGFEGEDGGFKPLAGSMFLDADKPPFSSGYIVNNESSAIAARFGLETATANTVNRTCTDPAHVERLLRQFPAEIETMESASLSYVCGRRGAPYAEIRCTSNHIVPKSLQKWELDGAIRTLGINIDAIIKEICK